MAIMLFIIMLINFCVCYPFPLHFFLTAQQPPLGHGPLFIKASRSHSDTPHSVELLWTSDWSDTENSTRQHTTVTTDRHPCPRWDSNPTNPAV
jgi:hypothetical protein